MGEWVPQEEAGKANPRGVAFSFVQDQHGGLEMWALLVDTRFGISEGFFIKLEDGEGLVLSSGPEKAVSCILKRK